MAHFRLINGLPSGQLPTATT
ncbi:hypothetical protein CCACVL1_07448 [Corchorus capsularis]|uniref:Uncharacterized protein n=1 Tax=Corchorus capsularis TaxID=210143 RepID=A0A1R3J5W9_COCAP|nr:hypothetical protein CCACVL1_07448 [Corchorus capsularis]